MEHVSPKKKLLPTKISLSPIKIKLKKIKTPKSTSLTDSPSKFMTPKGKNINLFKITNSNL